MSASIQQEGLRTYGGPAEECTSSVILLAPHHADRLRQFYRRQEDAPRKRGAVSILVGQHDSQHPRRDVGI